MKKLQSLQSSNRSYDSIKDKKDRIELRSILAKRKKNNQNETNSQTVASNNISYEANFRESDSDSEKSIDNANFEEKTKLFDNKGSTDLSESASKSMNVIVDIHREYKEEKSVKENEVLEKKHLSSRELENSKVFSKTNTVRHKRSKLNSLKLQNHRRDNIKVDDTKVDSLDLIEEFKESFPINKKNTKRIETARNDEEKLEGKKQWAASKDLAEELKKPRRKRWSKDTTVIRLPETKGNSWTVASPGSTSSSIKKFEQPSLAKQSFAFDNEAFDSEKEEILRIETDHNDRKDTKIEMKEINQKSEEMELVTFESSQSSSSKETFKETAITIEDMNERLSRRSFKSRDRNTISETKHSDAFSKIRKSTSKRKESSEDKTNILLSDNSQNLGEVTAQSYDDSSEDVSPKDDQLFLINRKNKKSSKEYSDAVEHDESNDLDKNSISTSAADDVEIHDDDSKLKKFNRKKKSKYTEHEEQKKEKRRVRRNICTNVEEDSKKKTKVKFISVTIHRTDMLEIDYVTKHPMVKVHIVNAENGKYLKNEYGVSRCLQPMITGKFDFKENKSIVPVWEEEIIFQHNFHNLLKTDNEQVVLLFEIVDLLTFAEASFNYDKFGHESCWYKVAWAFLKPVGRNNLLHIDKKVRLQLYKPRKNSSQRFERFHTCEIYTWWKSNMREKYPSSLFVTVTSIDPPKLEPVFYKQLSLNDLSNAPNESRMTSTRASESLNLPKWTRLAAQSCKIPNEIFFETDASENGCFCVAFSNDGKYLACCFSEEQDYPIVVHEVETKKIRTRFTGHKTFVYSLDWSNNDTYLLSLSSDQTARIWDVKNQIVGHVEMMPHPSYVYCGKFDPDNSSIVATGCYDRVARIWIQEKKSKNRDLIQELEGHEGYVNSMCFQKNSNLLTADSVGIIIVWMLKKSRRVSSRKEWHISRKIKVREIDGVIINTIILHPLESRLLVHSRNNGLRMLDLATGVVLQKYNELNNQRIQSTACISPCGSLILCGGEDSSLNVWNLETGSLLAKYTFHRNYRAVTCVDYHPYDHVLAFSTFGSPAPVRILKFNKDATGEDTGLKMMTNVENVVNSGDISMRFLNTSVNTPKERDTPKSRSSSRKELIEEIPKARSLQLNRDNDSSLLRATDLSEKNRYIDAKMKLQRLDEAGQTLKSRSANRLYNIIEKIDRILSNTSRSSGDIESGRNLTFLQESNESKILTSLYENVEERKRRPRRDKSAIGDRSNSYFESSTSSSDKQDVVECHSLRDTKTDSRNVKKKSNNVKKISVDMEGAMNYKKNKVYDKTSSPENIQSDFANDTKKNERKSVNDFKKEDSNSSDSAGTYIIEKNDAKDNIKDSIKVLDTDTDLNAVKNFGSDSSILSNATFSIENEIPVPKTRKKSKSSLL